jgi:hypothetical protein
MNFKKIVNECKGGRMKYTNFIKYQTSERETRAETYWYVDFEMCGPEDHHEASLLFDRDHENIVYTVYQYSPKLFIIACEELKMVIVYDNDSVTPSLFHNMIRAKNATCIFHIVIEIDSMSDFLEIINLSVSNAYRNHELEGEYNLRRYAVVYSDIPDARHFNSRF